LGMLMGFFGGLCALFWIQDTLLSQAQRSGKLNHSISSHFIITILYF
jgi:hypothetical protein